MIDSGFTFAADATALLRAGALLVAILMVLATWVKTRAAVPVIATMILAGAVLWAVTADGLGWFSDRIDDDAARLSSAAVTVEPDVSIAVEGDGGGRVVVYTRQVAQ